MHLQWTRAIGAATFLLLVFTNPALGATNCFPDSDSGGRDQICDTTEYVPPESWPAYQYMDYYGNYAVGETVYYRYLKAGAPTPAAAGSQSIVLDDGSRYTPAPGTVQPTQDELYQNTRVACDGEQCNTGMESDDPDAIAFQNATESDATTSTAAPGAQVDPSPTPPPVYEPLEKSFHKDEDFGNSKFGGGYALDGSLSAIPASGSTSAQLRAFAEGKANARFFGSSGEVVRAALTAASDQNSSINSNLSVFVLGFEVYKKPLLPAAIDEYALFNREFYKSPTVTFSVFGYDIQVAGSVTGSAGAKLSGTLSVAGPRLILTPEAGVYGNASASVRVYVFRIGVEGTLTLLNLKSPVTLTLIASSCNELDWALSSDLVANTLSGKLKLFVKIKLLFIKKKKSITITSWSGQTRNYNLFTLNGRQPLNFICTSSFLNEIAAAAPPPPPPPAPPPPEEYQPPRCTRRPCPYAHVDY